MTRTMLMSFHDHFWLIKTIQNNSGLLRILSEPSQDNSTPPPNTSGSLRTAQDYSGLLTTTQNPSGVRTTQNHSGLFRNYSGLIKTSLELSRWLMTISSGPCSRPCSGPHRTTQDHSRPFSTTQVCSKHHRTTKDSSKPHRTIQD